MTDKKVEGSLKDIQLFDPTKKRHKKTKKSTKESAEEKKIISEASNKTKDLTEANHKEEEKRAIIEGKEEKKVPVSSSVFGPDFKPYDYKFLLDRIQGELKITIPQLSAKSKHKVEQPDLSRVGGKRTAWTNFSNTCDNLKRKPEHLLQFVANELNTEAAISGEDQHLLMKGVYNDKQIENVLSKYIREYVKCQSCGNTNTTLNKDPSTRKYFMHCLVCQSTRTVQVIKTVYHATSKGYRKKN